MQSLTAVVASRNEGHLLERCLKSLSFCSEIIVINLDSVDNTVEIAQKYATKIVHHHPVNHIEIIHLKISEYTNNNWIILIDPDEVIADSLKENIVEIFSTAEFNKISTIRVPWRFHFKEKKLNGTRWGGDNMTKDNIVNLAGIEFSSYVHNGRQIRPGFKEFAIPLNKNKSNVLHHYWMTSYKQLFEKHQRYIKAEAEVMQAAGYKFSFVKQLKDTISEFRYLLISTKAYKDGLTGLFLSFFWAWYTYMKWSSLKKYQKTNT